MGRMPNLPMIDLAIQHIAGHLNQFLRRSFDLQEDVVAVSNLLEQDGSLAGNLGNKLVVFLINVEKDPESSHRNDSAMDLKRSVVSYPPLYLNLYLAFAGNFTGNNYPEALKFLSHTIGFFQRRPIFDHTVTPDLDDRIEKLVMEIENLNLRDLSTLWGAISGRYLPSIIYKVRGVILDSGDIVEQVPRITSPQSMLR